MTILQSILIAFSYFSRVPMPHVEWSVRGMRYMMAALPLVGVVCGALVWLWLFLCQTLAFGAFLQGAGVILVVLLVTGGIHMDGFCDVTDALASNAEPERKRAILKDPHIGAFAAIGVAAYVLGFAAFASELPQDAMAVGPLLLALLVTSRAAGGTAALCFPKSTEKGTVAYFQSAHKRIASVVLLLWAVAAFVFALRLSAFGALAVLACSVVSLLATYFIAKHQFGGMSGDLAGFCIQLAELLGVIALAVLSKAVGL